MDVLQWLNLNHELATRGMTPGIIPMVLIPLTAVTVAITSLAGIIAGWFGIKLNTEGPKQFLEVLLKKRILISMLLMNLAGVGIYKSYKYVQAMPRFLFTISRHSNNESVASSDHYTESRFRPHEYIGEITPVKFLSLSLEQTIKLKMGAFRTGLLSGNSLFYGVDDGYVYELNKSDLSTKRTFYLGTQATTRPITYKDRIYSGEGNHDTHHARIYSFDLKSGKYINSFTTTGHTEGQPLIGTFQNHDLLFIPAGGDGLYAVDPLTMEEVWHKNDGHLDASVTVESNQVFIGTGVEKGQNRERSYAISYEFLTGKVIWKKELPLSSWMHPVVTNTDVCYVLGEIYFPSNIGLFYCLNKIDGTPHFTIPFDAPMASKPFYIRDHEEEYVFVASFTGEMCGISITHKEKTWCKQTGNSKTSYALSSFDYDVKHGLLWYPSMDNGLYAVEPKSGKIITHWLPGPQEAKWESNYASITIDDNFLYQMDIDGNLRKFKINDKI